MDKLGNQEVLDARLDDWRKLAQALHARYRIADFTAGAACVAEVAQAPRPLITIRNSNWPTA